VLRRGFEGDWGNTYALGNQQPDVDDVHMFGIIATLFDNDETSAVLNWAHAWDITDGFTGLTVMPFIVSPRIPTASSISNRTAAAIFHSLSAHAPKSATGTRPPFYCARI
jgi:hypothetical protein